ncbi:hypothetical protein [Paracoccus ravus]|uniref:hypothetical protein n=1 Tax=Paracoccus ravus TaxID=2447760 RepID=UPI00106DE415|nr:hypothetical protein [Paracoccus ravus]
MARKSIRNTALTCLVAVLSFASVPASAELVTHEENRANPRGWSAIAGTEPRAVRDMARELPVSDQATADQPWCAASDEIAQSLSEDFEEEKVATNGSDTALWGSDMMGTWTVVLERPDATSCVIASGIGFSADQGPRRYFVQAGLLR